MKKIAQIIKELAATAVSQWWPFIVQHFGLIIILCVSAVIIPTNIYLFKDATTNNTISASMTKLWHWNVAAPLFAGGLYGHWCSRDFAPILIDRGNGLPAEFFFGFLAASFLVDLLFQGSLAAYPSVIWVSFGFPIGFLSWQMAEIAT